MKRVVLASSSPRRRALLEQIGLNFIVRPSDYEEDMKLDMEPMVLARHLSEGKAKDIAAAHQTEDIVVIGADSIVVCGGSVLGKPYTPEKAREMLQLLRGKTCQVITGYTLIDCLTGEVRSGAKSSNVRMRDYSDEEIDSYIATGEPLDKAGSYALQDKGVLLIDGIEGDYSNVIGLPLTDVALALRELGIEVWQAPAAP